MSDSEKMECLDMEIDLEREQAQVPDVSCLPTVLVTDISSTKGIMSNIYIGYSCRNERVIRIAFSQMMFEIINQLKRRCTQTFIFAKILDFIKTTPRNSFCFGPFCSATLQIGKRAYSNCFTIVNLIFH